MVKTVVEEFENKIKNDIQSFNLIYTKSLTLADMHKIEVKNLELVQNKLIAQINQPKTQEIYFCLTLYLLLFYIRN